MTHQSVWGRLAGIVVASAILLGQSARAWAGFVTFESGHVRPLALSPDGTRLFAVNTPDNRLEILTVGPGGLTPLAAVPVGLEPVAVASRTNGEVWVVNHLSDSVSVVDVASSPPRVVRTLLVGDEPRDVVFAGPGGTRAFVTCAHRGQNNPNDPQLETPGVGRADVWAFDATNPGAGLGGTPLSIVTLFGDTPRALAVSPDGATVYAAVFQSGNQTATVTAGVVCGLDSAPPCTVNGVTYPGGVPAPNDDANGVLGPVTGLIVKFNPTSGHFEDTLARDWDNAIKFSLPDADVFRIDATANPPEAVPGPGLFDGQPFAGVGTVLFNMAVNPVSGRVYVTNGEARNEVRFEGPGGGGTSVRGRLHEARITVLDPVSGTVEPRHLNKHIDYGVVPSPAGTSAKSLATPTDMAVTQDGTTLYVAALGSSVIGAFDVAELENDTFVPSAADHIALSGGGPSGLVLDEPRQRLYAFTRFDNAISVVDTTTREETQHLPLFNPEPPSVVAGRPFLYDARATSSNGEAACASCHAFGDFDSLAWDLGNPDDVVLHNPNPFRLTLGENRDFHPLKGPMTTQTLRGMANHGPMHWRGDRTGGNDLGGNALAEDQAFKKFNVAFPGLLGRAAQLTPTEMQMFTNFILQVTLPPNPIRALDNSLTPDEQAGRDFYFNVTSDVVQTCNGCHALNPVAGFFGTDGLASFEGETQDFKIPHLRNLYQKVGMFGLPDTPFVFSGDNGHQGPQIRGFGYLHDGSVDTIFRFHRATLFSFSSDAQRRQMERFMFAFDTNLAPIVGQQITMTATNGAVVGPRIDLMIARSAAGDCDLIVKGTVAGEQRGWYRKISGVFQGDRAETPLFDFQLRALAGVAGQALTYTCAPPGSGLRIGVDRDDDGWFDRYEIDHGTDPSDPASFPGAPTTTTTSTTLPGSAAVLISAKTMNLRDGSVAPPNPARRKLVFKTSTKTSPGANRVVPPAPGSGGDPTIGGGELRVYNATGATTDDVTVPLVGGWSMIGSGTGFRGWKYVGSTGVKSVKVTADKVSVKAVGAAWGYSLDEPSQGTIALQLSLGGMTWCASVPAKLTGNPPTTAPNDRQDRFIGHPRTPPPPICPAP